MVGNQNIIFQKGYLKQLIGIQETLLGWKKNKIEQTIILNFKNKFTTSNKQFYFLDLNKFLALQTT